jgi:hypothetical protein
MAAAVSSAGSVRIDHEIKLCLSSRAETNNPESEIYFSK